TQPAARARRPHRPEGVQGAFRLRADRGPAAAGRARCVEGRACAHRTGGAMILALESSCDETAVAGFDPARGLVGEWVHSQVALHEKHGGVVPDLATREHLRNFAPLLERAKREVDLEKITQVAVTNGPGLAACLAIGVAAAKSLALALRVPLTGV